MVEEPFWEHPLKKQSFSRSLTLSKTPLRISWLGGGTDFHDYYSRSGGCFVSSAIDQYIYTTFKEHGERYEENIRLNYSTVELVGNHSQLKNRIVSGVLSHLGIEKKVYVSTVSDIPAGSGLGSSSAFCVGLLGNIFYSCGIGKTPGELAAIANHIEISLNKNPQGIQDAYPAAYGGFNFYKVGLDGTVTVQEILIREENYRLLNESLYLVYTGRVRLSNEILGEQADNTANLKNSRLLDSLVEKADGFVAMLRNNFSLDLVGNYLNDSWAIKRQFATGVTDSSLDSLYMKILSAGAIGAKLCGAGGGGFFLCVVDPMKSKSFLNTIGTRYVTKIRMVNVGTSITHL